MIRFSGMFLIAVAFVLVSSNSALSQKTSACDNVAGMLAMYHLEKSVEVIKCYESYVTVKPVLRSDGTTDNSLWEFVQEHHNVIKDWTHDNALISWVEGHGKYSFRQKCRPSMQVTFHKVKNNVAKYIKIDLDRYPPSARAWVTSARHFLQEQFPNLVFGKKTNADRMHDSLVKLYGNRFTGAQ